MPDLVEQRGQRHAGPFAARQHPVRVLHGRHRDVAPLHAGIGAAFDEVDARHRREADDVVHREDARIGHQAVDHQPVLVRIDLGHAGVVALEVQAGRRDDAEQVLQRRERDRRLRRAREAGAFAAAHVGLEPRRHAVGRREDRRAERAGPLRDVGGQVLRQAAVVGGPRGHRGGGRERAAADGRRALQEAASRRRRRGRQMMFGRRTNAPGAPRAADILAPPSTGRRRALRRSVVPVTA